RAIIGASLGIAIAPYDGLEVDDLIKSADLALYAAKGGGRGQYRFYSNDLKDSADERREIEEDLRDALAYRSYIINYGLGLEMVRAHVEAAGSSPEARWERMRRILSEPTLPSDLEK